MNETTCKICGSEIKESFRIPCTKLTGHPIPSNGEECIYYECLSCYFCFTNYEAAANQEDIYGEEYWKKQDSGWYGRMTESFRLIYLASMLLPDRTPWDLTILDFGSGTGTFVRECREKFGMDIYGHDIIQPIFAKDRFVSDLAQTTLRFDIILSCEVLEHLPDPIGIISKAISVLKPGGVFVFQTAYYDPRVCNRDWWYVGPANGHVSFYSIQAFDYLFTKLGGKGRMSWNGYPGVQAWQF